MKIIKLNDELEGFLDQLGSNLSKGKRHWVYMNIYRMMELLFKDVDIYRVKAYQKKIHYFLERGSVPTLMEVRDGFEEGTVTTVLMQRVCPIQNKDFHCYNKNPIANLNEFGIMINYALVEVLFEKELVSEERFLFPDAAYGFSFQKVLSDYQDLLIRETSRELLI